MHILQPKHTKLSEKESKEILEKFNVSKSQIPKILSSDPGLFEGCEIGDIIKIERKELIESEDDKLQSKEEHKTYTYYRVVV